MAFPCTGNFRGFFAYFLKVNLSGSNLNHVKLYSCLVFNWISVAPYMGILTNNRFLFFGYWPDIIIEHHFVGWIAFICIFIHLFALPVKRKVKWWFHENNSHRINICRQSSIESHGFRNVLQHHHGLAHLRGAGYPR
jgi:hypothetical protein